MSAHTPGPWEVHPEENRRAFAENLVVADGVAVAIALNNEERGAGWTKCEANARLIAAAPDLLESLRALVEVASECIPETAGHELEQARAAIAKAEGKP